MKKIGILTINDNNNYGNRLQNYAIQQVIKNKLNYEVETIYNYLDNNTFSIFKFKIKLFFKKILKKKVYKRYKNFLKFDRNIIYSKTVISNKSIPNNLNDKYDYFITGSDQVWNPNFNRLSDIDLLSFAEPKKRISFSASFGVDNLPEQYHSKMKNELSKFKAISTREVSGKKIIEDIVSRKDIEVLVDPTMLIAPEEWDKLVKRPNNLKNNRYILNYFLGELSEERRQEINRFAEENNYEVINILDRTGDFYECGPSEFLYLEKNASLVCTDSFHSTIFAIIYRRPFLVFDREDSKANMNSRLETLLNNFKLNNRKFEGKIEEEKLEVHYDDVDLILKEEQIKSINWLKNNLFD